MVKELIAKFDDELFCEFVNSKFAGSFSRTEREIPEADDFPWDSARQLGVVKNLPGANDSNMPLLIVAAKFPDGEELKERSSRIKQFKFAKRVLDEAMSNPALGVDGVLSQGLFAFYDELGNFRLSLVYGKPEGVKLIWSTAKRFSFHVEAGQVNKTFRDRAALDWSSFAKLQEAFSVEKLTKEFYKELSDWYFWALSKVRFPDDDKREEETRNATMTIRLITRLMFVWFLKHKKLIPEELFSRETADELLNYKDKTDSTYYKAFLQNLFFATLNLPMTGNDRRFVKRQAGCHYYRYNRFFKGEDERKRFIQLCKNIPFLNGGLFENLDKDVGTEKEVRIDGFSNRMDQEERLSVPDELFFAEEQFVDLSKQYSDTRKKKVKVRGLLNILKTYYFTVEENSPQDQDVALDPELLGRVFENLLASYNPETQTTARKETGSFYTPREIVNYMVNQSLIEHLKVRLGDDRDSSIESKVRKLFEGDTEDNPFSEEDTEKIIEAIFSCKILDPACGSGAFPMGALQCMVAVLNIVDPDNRHWEKLARQQARKETDKALSEVKQGMEDRLAEIGRIFDQNTNRPDYARKLYLIENCIFGVDIQPIAVQISKLRFFISLIVEQMPSDDFENNLDIRPLPNLETKFVAANSLIGIDMPDDWTNDPTIVRIENELREIRRRHFSARTSETKQKYRALDREKRDELREHLVFIANNPDQEKIALYHEEIEKLEQELKPYLDEKWVSKVKESELHFGEDESGDECVQVDENATKRSELEKRIRKCRNAIEKEEAKASKDAFQKEAEKLAKWDPYDQNASAPFFDAEWMFNVDYGFDVVIGNPPYIHSRSTLISKAVKEYCTRNFSTVEYQLNTFVVFTELGIKMLRTGGILSYIIPNYWLSSERDTKLRHFLFKTNWVRELVNVYRVFDSANVDTLILLASKKEAGTKKTLVRSIDPEAGLTAGRLEEVFLNHDWTYESERQLGTSAGDINISFSKGVNVEFPRSLADFFIFKFGIKLYEYGKGNPTQTKEDIRKRIYTAKHQLDSTYSELIGAGNVKHYRIAGNKGWIKYGEHLAAPRTPELFSGPRILLRRIVGTRLDAAFIDGWLPSNTDVIVMKPKNVQETNCLFFLGLLCSKLISHLARSGNVNLDRQAFPKINTNTIEKLPVPSFTKANAEAVASLVSIILDALNSNPAADTSALEAEIDQLVYELYDLTPEEVAIVEESVGQKSEAKSIEAKSEARAEMGQKKSRKRETELPPSLPGWD